MQKRSFNNTSDIVKKILKGDIRLSSQLLTQAERRDPIALPILKSLYPHTGHANLIGVTGPAGVGKSTLINRLITAFRKKKKSVGILAIDPSSPLSGGAILGDRLRMHQHFLDKAIFIRSLSTRGSWGGLSPALFDAIHILDAMGKDIVLIETIGVGQDEVRIAKLAELVLLVLSPGMGDSVQTMKSGLMEIGDVVAVNKGDQLEGAQLAEELQELDSSRPVIQISAEKGTGLPKLVSQLKKRFMKKTHLRIKQEHFVREELQWLLNEKLNAPRNKFPFSRNLIRQVMIRGKNPYEAVEKWRDKN